MSIRRLPACAVLAATACLIVGCGSSTHLADRHASACALGTALDTASQLLAPRPGTFYSVDVLNPNVVFFHERYLMYFSGNDRRTEEGNWREGVAIATSPTGPFRVQKLKGNYLNGGIAVWKRRLWHVVEDNPIHGSKITSEIASSRDGVHWRHESFLPGFTAAGVTYRGADFWLEPQGSHLGVYMLLVPPQGGIRRSLGFASYSAGHWSNFHIVLPITRVANMLWASADLGEPATFSAAGRRHLLFVGLAEPSLTRSIGLALETTTGWSVCNNEPALANGVRWGPASSIDPSSLVVGDRLYLYYGATRTSGFGANLGGSVVVRTFRLPTGLSE